MQKRYLITVFLVLISLQFANANIQGFVVSSDSFEVDTLVLKLSVKQDSSLEKTIEIENTGATTSTFKVGSNMDCVSFDSDGFSLASGNSKKVLLNFNLKDKSLGVYSGVISVSNSDSQIKIPTIIELESEEVLFDSILSIPIDYSSVQPGESLVVQNRIFDLENVGKKNVKVSYYVKSFDGKTVFSDNENLLVDREFSTSKVINLPNELEEGDYLFFTVVEYGGSVGTSSHFFKVGGTEFSFDFDNDLYIWIVLVLLLFIIIFILYNQRQRDKLILELSRQRRSELGREVKRVEEEKSKIKSVPLKKRKRELMKIKKKSRKRVKIIDRIYKSRVKTIKRLKKEKKKSQIQEKMDKWRKQGYNVGELFVEEKKNDIKSHVRKLKKKGYKF